MKYKVIRDCYGFKNKFWCKGEVVDLEIDENPPIHFLPMHSKSSLVMPETPVTRLEKKKREREKAIEE